MLGDPIESEARLVRHNMKVLTDSLTDDCQRMMMMMMAMILRMGVPLKINMMMLIFVVQVQ